MADPVAVEVRLADHVWSWGELVRLADRDTSRTRGVADAARLTW